MRNIEGPMSRNFVGLGTRNFWGPDPTFGRHGDVKFLGSDNMQFWGYERNFEGSITWNFGCQKYEIFVVRTRETFGSPETWNFWEYGHGKLLGVRTRETFGGPKDRTCESFRGPDTWNFWGVWKYEIFEDPMTCHFWGSQSMKFFGGPDKWKFWGSDLKFFGVWTCDNLEGPNTWNFLGLDSRLKFA